MSLFGVRLSNRKRRMISGGFLFARTFFFVKARSFVAITESHGDELEDLTSAAGKGSHGCSDRFHVDASKNGKALWVSKSG